jgi:catechol 2,3-dioxygenase-like lactoylglutathione lyase family enzyme
MAHQPQHPATPTEAAAVPAAHPDRTIRRLRPGRRPLHSESHTVKLLKAAGKQMARVVGIDHISIRVSNFERSKAFYSGLFAFLGFNVMEESGEDAIGWSNGETRYWIGKADAQGRKHKYRIGDVGLHHYAFQLRSRKDVDDLQKYLRQHHVPIVDPADEYYDDYYAVFFLDPDGMKLEGMKYGEKHARAKTEKSTSKSHAAEHGHEAEDSAREDT